MVKKNTTIDELALMVKKGFDGVDKSFDKVATKEQVDNFEKWTKEKVNKLEKDVSEIKILVKDDHRRRIEKLEMRVEYLENALDLPSKK